MTKPTTKPIKTIRTGSGSYSLFSDGQLWKNGKYGFLVTDDCGHPDHMEPTVDFHEEEMRVCHHNEPNPR